MANGLGAVSVRGYRELQRAFAVASDEMKKDMKMAMLSAADPVKREATALAMKRIRNMTVPWSEMRVGVTQSSVYVAPVERGVSRWNRSKARPNLSDLMLDRAMEPALENNREKVMREFEDALEDMAKAWGRV